MSDTENNEALVAEANQFREEFKRARESVQKIIVGQDRVVEGALTAILCGGNVLLEGLPGLGKTELVKTLSRALDLNFNRVQFTPDLMPADIIGTNVMTQTPEGGYAVQFRPGPIFTQLLLADEINRATPKTQAALLEPMQEGSVTVSGEGSRGDVLTEFCNASIRSRIVWEHCPKTSGKIFSMFSRR